MDLKQCIAQYADDRDSFYLYDEEGIRQSARNLKTNFPQVSFLYSIKCNPNPQILDCIFSEEFGADAASAGEVQLAWKAGLRREQIYYSAPGKSMADLEDCLEKAVLIADSPGELTRIQKAAEKSGTIMEVGIRVNPGFSFSDDCAHTSKFGIDEDQALQLIGDSCCKNIRIVGLHIHLRCQILQADVLTRYYQKVLSLAERFMQVCGSLKFVNLGSGMGVPYAPGDRPLDLSELSRTVGPVLNRFRAAHPETELMIEVGRYVTCKNGYYVTRVMDRKVSCGKTYLILKNTLNGFLRPSLARFAEHLAGGENPVGAESLVGGGDPAETESHACRENSASGKHPAGVEPLFTEVDAFEFLTLKEEEPTETVTLVGNLCTAADVIAEDIRMPRLECGDLIIVTNAGSYAATLSPFQFSSQEKPEEVFHSGSIQ